MKCLECDYYNPVKDAGHNSKSDGYCALVNGGKNCVDECPPRLAALRFDLEATRETVKAFQGLITEKDAVLMAYRTDLEAKDAHVAKLEADLTEFENNKDNDEIIAKLAGDSYRKEFEEAEKK